MTFIAWFFENGFNFLQSIGIVGSLWYAGRSFRLNVRERRASTLFEVIKSHRQIWSQLYERPELARIRDLSPNLKVRPITVEEELFVTQLILHLSGVFYAGKEGVIFPLEGSKKDIQQFFERPIPREIWLRRRPTQENEFVEFMDSTLAQDDPLHSCTAR